MLKVTLLEVTTVPSSAEELFIERSPTRVVSPVTSTLPVFSRVPVFVMLDLEVSDVAAFPLLILRVGVTIF